MWAKLNSGGDTIEEIIVNTKQMLIDEVNHPKTLFTLWTDAERLAVGIVPVTTTGTHLNPSYYIETDPTYAIASDKASVVRTIGEKTADKVLADVDDVDADNNAIVDDHDNQTITLGLKSVAKNNANVAADEHIKGFNWLVQRKVTHDTAIPSDILTYISSVRTAHASICTAIDNASDMAAFVVLHVDVLNDDDSVKTVAKVNDWPDDYAVAGRRR